MPPLVIEMNGRRVRIALWIIPGATHKSVSGSVEKGHYATKDSFDEVGLRIIR